MATSMLVLFVTACADTAPLHSDFQVGANRGEIISRFGTPTRIQSLTKQRQTIWGPIEEVWDLIPQGGSVEIWAYRSRMHMEGADDPYIHTGETELYFIDASQTVNATGFLMDGAVYEGDA